MVTKSSKSPKVQTGQSRIADNKKAMFNYAIEERFEAGMVLQGWEVKALREGKVELTDGTVHIERQTAVGYDVVEYDAQLWNNSTPKVIIHLDLTPFDVDVAYNPAIEVLGDVADSLRELALKLELHEKLNATENALVVEATMERQQFADAVKAASPAAGLVHPIQIVHALQHNAGLDTIFGREFTALDQWVDRRFRGSGRLLIYRGSAGRRMGQIQCLLFKFADALQRFC